MATWPHVLEAAECVVETLFTLDEGSQNMTRRSQGLMYLESPLPMGLFAAGRPRLLHSLPK